jgi:hypothetical protein
MMKPGPGHAADQNGAGARLFHPTREKWADIVVILGPRAAEAEALVVMAPGKENIRTIGRFQYRDGFEDVWLGGEHYNLRGRNKARLCIQYLIEQQAFTAASARHFVKEIDPYVRNKGDYLPAAEIKIDHYFADLNGRLPRLRKDLVRAAGRNGKFYLKTD